MTHEQVKIMLKKAVKEAFQPKPFWDNVNYELLKKIKEVKREGTR